MKHFTVLILIALCAASVFGLEINTQTMTAEGSWVIQDGRLVQTDSQATRAKFAIPYPQFGETVYEFNVKYEGGVLEDGHGGFGIHLFADGVKMGRAWGAGDSWLVWLNYDVNAEDINSGLSAQVYKSINNSRMDLIADYDLNWALDNLTEMAVSIDQLLRQTVTIKLKVNPVNGDVTFYDPFTEDYVYRFSLPVEEPMSGSMVVLRSNGMELSFAQ